MHRAPLELARKGQISKRDWRTILFTPVLTNYYVASEGESAVGPQLAAIIPPRICSYKSSSNIGIVGTLQAGILFLTVIPSSHLLLRPWGPPVGINPRLFHLDAQLE